MKIHVQKYRDILTTLVFPLFEKLKLREVDDHELQRLFNDLRSGKARSRADRAREAKGLKLIQPSQKSLPYSSDYISKCKSLLNRFFKYALKRKYIRQNPMDFVEIPKANTKNTPNGKKARTSLSPNVRKLVLELVEANPILRPISLTSIFTGLRPQELICLKWTDINFNTRLINISKAINKTVEFDRHWNVTSTGSKEGLTKTVAGLRNVPITNPVEMVLKDWQQYLHSKNLSSIYVFPNTKTGGMRTYSSLRSLIQRFVNKHRLQDENITLYSLRHTFATILLEQRENPKIIAALMGHVKVNTALTHYSHVFDETLEETVRTLDRVYDTLTEEISSQDDENYDK